MKKNLLFATFVALAVICSTYIRAQDSIVFDPALLEPDSAGYYIAGYDKEDPPGTFTHYDSCSDEFQESHHYEAGTQLDFTFAGCMVMPTCQSKNLPSQVSSGYIQMRKRKYEGTDSLIFGYIDSPPVINVDSMYIEASPDNTPRSDRDVEFALEYSTDGGTTFDPTVFTTKRIPDNDKDGTKFHITPVSDLAFEVMSTASDEGSIILRVRSSVGANDGEQRMRIHKIIIYGTSTVGINTYSISNYDEKFFFVNNNVVKALKGTISVYNPIGQLIGTGTEIPVKSGLYIVRSQSGVAKKVYITNH